MARSKSVASSRSSASPGDRAWIDFVAFVRQQQRERVEDVRLIVGDEDPDGAGFRHAVDAASKMYATPGARAEPGASAIVSAAGLGLSLSVRAGARIRPRVKPGRCGYRVKPTTCARAALLAVRRKWPGTNVVTTPGIGSRWRDSVVAPRDARTGARLDGDGQHFARRRLVRLLVRMISRMFEIFTEFRMSTAEGSDTRARARRRRPARRARGASLAAHRRRLRTAVRQLDRRRHGAAARRGIRPAADGSQLHAATRRPAAKGSSSSRASEPTIRRCRSSS